MEKTYQKIAFVWEMPTPQIDVPDRLAFKSVSPAELKTLVNLVGRVMKGSLDRSDQKSISEVGAQQAATTFIDEVDQYFEFQREWWQLATNKQGQLVGFVLPVLFHGAEKDGLGEGTIYYLGVTPEQRGNKYAYDLLCCGTAILQEIGVWRVYSDTDVLNFPMIKTFQDVGYRKFGEPKDVSL